MQERRTIDINEAIGEATGPNARVIRRTGLMHAVLEAMGRRSVERMAAKVPKPKEGPKPVNRHERRKAAALARRGR